MKKLLFVIITLVLALTLVGCKKNEKTIFVGATPSPHAEILNSKAFKDYVESKGYKLEVKVYQDYVTPNKALSDGGIDANYFQHIPYLTEECETKGYKLAVACEVHNEPLNLYGKTKITDFSNKTIYIINDVSNVERAFKLLVAQGIISTYSVENFDAQNPVYTSSINASVQCIDAGLLHAKVEEGGYAVIPGNYALTAWNATKAAEYKIVGESTEVAYPNILAVREEDVDSEKIKVLCEAFASEEVKKFIEETYGPTVNYCYKKH